MTIRDDETCKRDDDGLETYLKQFQPVQAAPLPHREVVGRARHSYAPMILAVSFVMLLLVGSLTLDRHAEPASKPALTKSLMPAQPPSGLTISNANLLLKESPSVREVLNLIARDPQTSLPQEGKSSAFAALGKENFKL